MTSRLLILISAAAAALACVPGPSAAAQVLPEVPAGYQSSLGATVVTLRATVRVDAGTVLRLGDVANIDGPLARELGGIDLGREPLSPDAGWVRLSLDEIKTALKRHGTDPATVALQGSSAEVSARHAEPRSAGGTATAAQPSASAEAPLTDTVRTRIEQRLSGMYDVDAQDLRLTFRDADAEALKTPTAGRVVEVTPSGASRELPLSITVYAEDRIELRTTVRVNVEIRRTVLRANRSISRGSALNADAFEREVLWVSPLESLASLDQVDGAVTTTAIRAGELIRRRDIEPPVLVRRGDLVMVHCISGTLIVKTEARALSTGRAGDLVEFEVKRTPGRASAQSTAGGGGEPSRFRARMVSPGIAVCRVSDQQGVAMTQTDDED